MPVTPESVLLFNALPKPYLLLSPEFMIEAVSDAYLRATLTQRARLVGHYVFDVFPDNPLTPEAQSVHNLRASLRQVRATGQPHAMAQQHYDVPDPAHPGQFVERHWQPLNTPVLDAHGQVVQIIHSALDVTAHVQAHAHLRQSQAAAQAASADAEAQRQRLHDILMQLPARVAINRGPDHVFDLVNPRYQQLFPARQLQGLPVREALPELAEQQFFELLDQVYQTGEPFYGHAMPAAVDYTNSGQREVRYFDVFFQALRDAQGRIDGILNFAYDVTVQVEARQQVQVLNEELRAANAELHTSNQQLTRTNVDLDTFVYMASHDLKAPITNIEGITLALRDTLPADVQQEEMIAHLLDLLAQSTTRFQATIGQLTDLSKLQLAHAGPPEQVNLAAVVESVRLDLAQLSTEANAHLTVEVAPDLVVSFSPANLRSAIYNLLSNAVKYRALDRPAQVRVRAFLAGPRIVLEVQDNGLGMSEVQQRQLFGLFQRLHTHVEGTGVGLYITKRLVENGGGTIAVESQVDVGTTFTLTFPA